MIRFLHRTAAALVLSFFAAAAPAAAQYNVTWVSETGEDGNSCNPAEPCDTFAGAYAKTNAGGTIKCADPGYYGYVAISKSITIDCTDAQGGTAATDSIEINGVGIKVILRGLEITGFGDGSTSGYGISMVGTPSVVVENCIIRSNNGPALTGNGIRVANASGTAELTLINTTITNNRRMGLLIAPTGSGSAKVMVSRSTMVGNHYGIFTDADGSTGRIDLAIVDSVISTNSGHGVAAKALTGVSRAIVERSMLFGNGVSGLDVNGAGATVLLRESAINNNSYGTSVVNGGRLFSFGNNSINNNDNNGPNPTLIISK